MYYVKCCREFVKVRHEASTTGGWKISLFRNTDINLILMDQFIVDYSIEIEARCSFVI
jgi:hypothetical protein